MGKTITAPADDFVAITPSDSTNFSGGIARAIYVGGDGDIAVVSPRGSVVTFAGALAGTILPVECVRVNTTNTTATNLVALY